tara:strand:- start:1 stop:399 length:399 start_codon:yes stop_codon:yes gene_type:complete
MSHRDLEKVADRDFSKFIRLRDSNDYGVVRCCTCKKESLWKEMDNGHFIKRDKRATRWEETNCNAQCRACNEYGKGEEAKHKEYIDTLYGENTADKLRHKGNEVRIYSRADLIAIIHHYRLKWKEFLKQKEN